LLLAVFSVFAGADALAQGVSADTLGLYYGQYTGLTGQDIRITIARVIQVGLGLLGIVAILIILYAGFLWMTAGGEEDRVQSAKKVLSAGIIGLVIIMSAFAIASFVLSRLIDASNGVGSVTGDGSLGGAPCIGLTATCPTGALGSGLVESHYPGRSATGIARNTRIVITFKKAIDKDSLIIGGDDATVAIIPSSAVAVSNRFPLKFAASLTADDINIVTADDKTFVLLQKNCSAAAADKCIGSPSENQFYTVAFRGGSDGVKLSGGATAFTGVFNGGYAWEFQASTILDLTPPTVASSQPVKDSDGNPRNTLIQINFSEAVDPLGVGSISVTQGGSTRVAGENQIGNAYRTVEFRSDEPCGTNSCGETIYCLPGNAAIATRVPANGMTGSPPVAVFPPNGVTDMAGNSLDGDADGKAEGPPGDDYRFSFSTDDTVDLTPPVIVSETPDLIVGAPVGNIARDLPITATFSKLMSATSMTSDRAQLITGPGAAPVNYSLYSDALSSAQGVPPDQTKAAMAHDLFAEDTPYASNWTSGLRDLRQNCFYPGGGQTVCAGQGQQPYCCNGLPSATICAFAAP
jgi:hypothetical protein